MSPSVSSHRAAPTAASFLYAWRQRFNASSPDVRAAFALLCRLFLERSAETEDAWRQWLQVWRSASAPVANEKSTTALREWTDALPEPERSALDPGDPDAHDRLFFILQTFVAQVLLAVVALDYDLDVPTLDALFDPFPFQWGAPARDALRLTSADLAALRLQATASVRDPFAGIYARFFSSPIRRALGEFYTPAPLAQFLCDRAERLWRESNPGSDRVPTLLDPTCGAGVFLTAAFRRRVASGVSTASALGGLRGSDVSPLAALAARANLLYAATTPTVPDALAASTTASRRAALEQLVAERRALAPDEPTLPVELFDALRLRSPFDDREPTTPPTRYDIILGNPPWLVWDRLSEEYRASTRELWTDYGLFTLSATAARYGGGKKELAGLIVDVSVARRLAAGGIFGFVTPQSLFQTSTSGEGFRRFGAGTDWSFTTLEIDDLSDLYLFTYVGSHAAAFLGRAGGETRYPILARRWISMKAKACAKRIVVESGTAPAPLPPEVAAAAKALNARVDVGTAAPSKPEISGSPLSFRFDAAIVRRLTPGSSETEGLRAEANRLAERLFEGSGNLSVENRYTAQLGANAAGASGVFWFDPATARAAGDAERCPEIQSAAVPTSPAASVDASFDPETLAAALRSPLTTARNLGDSGRRKTRSVMATVESALLFPLLRWRDVAEFRHAAPHTLMLVPQDPDRRRGFDPEAMRARFPRTLEYLEGFEEILRGRAAYKRYQSRAAYWSLYNVDASTFAPIKVVWRRMDAILRAAVVQYDERTSRPVVPQETLSFVPVATLPEADYLAAVLNSTPARLLVSARVAAGSRSFGAPGILDAIPVPRFDPSDPTSQALADLGMRLRLAAATSESTETSEQDAPETTEG